MNVNIFKQNIIELKTLSMEELEKRKLGIPGESTIQQLEKEIIPELDGLLLKIEMNNLPPKEKRYLNSFAYAFKVWEWNMQEPTELYIRLSRLNQDFIEL